MAKANKSLLATALQVAREALSSWDTVEGQFTKGQDDWTTYRAEAGKTCVNLRTRMQGTEAKQPGAYAVARMIFPALPETSKDMAASETKMYQRVRRLLMYADKVTDRASMPLLPSIAVPQTQVRRVYGTILSMQPEFWKVIEEDLVDRKWDRTRILRFQDELHDAKMFPVKRIDLPTEASRIVKHDIALGISPAMRARQGKHDAVLGNREEAVATRRTA